MQKRLGGGLFITLICVFIYFGGCIPQNTPKPNNSESLSAEENINRAELAEKNRELAKAHYFYKAAAEIYAKKQNETQSSISRVSKQMNQAQKDIEKAIAFIDQGRCAEAQSLLDSALAVRTDHPKIKELKIQIENCESKGFVTPPPTEPIKPNGHPTNCKFIKKKEYEHIVKRGDEIGKLCKRIYGRTHHFKLVHAIAEYNQINPDRLKRGQRIKFPTIKCNNRTYYPNIPSPPTPAVTPIPSVGSTPPPDDGEEIYKHEHYTKGTEYLEKELFGKAKTEFNLVVQKDADYLDVRQKMEEATIGEMVKNGRTLFDNAQYDEAIREFQQVASLQRDNEIVIEYLHKAYFEKAKSCYQKQELAEMLTNLESCFSYQCNRCDQYKKANKIEIISEVATTLEKESTDNMNKTLLLQRQKALKLLQFIKPHDQKIKSRLTDTEKLLEGFE